MKNIFIDDLSVNNQKYSLVIAKTIFLLILVNIIFLFSSLFGKNIIIQLIALPLLFSFFWIAKKIKINFLNNIRFNKKDMAYIIGGLLLGYIIIFVFNFISNKNTENEALLRESFQKKDIIFFLINNALIAPLVEEIIFRGLILRLIFRNHLFIGLIISSILFGISHYQDSLIEVIPQTLGGFIMGFVYLKTKKFQNVIAIHFLNNLIATIFLFFI